MECSFPKEIVVDLALAIVIHGTEAKAILNTYDEKLIYVDLGLRRNVSWYFQVACVSGPIMGADFFEKFNLLVDVKR